MTHLTNATRLWIYQNFKKFIGNDQYFKAFNSNVLLSVLKYVLSGKADLNLIIAEMKELGLDKDFKLFRKIDKTTNKPQYFKYPNLVFQMESLIDCWPEIIELEKKIRENYYEYEDTNSAQALIDPDEYNGYEKEYIKRGLYGLKPNIRTIIGLDENEITLHGYELSKITSIRSDFSYEYDSFKHETKSSVQNIAKNENSFGIFFQTDIAAFYHSITPTILRKFFYNNYPKSKNIRKYLRELEKKKEDELPIGWILSGTLAYFVLLKFHELLNKKLKRHLNKSLKDEKSNLSVLSVGITSYVDDFIFVVKTNETVVDETILENFEKLILEKSNQTLKELLGNDCKVRFHDFKAPKNKKFTITPEFATLLDSNFHDFMNNASALGDEADLLDDLMAPCENEMILNERAQFVKSLRALKNKIEDEEVIDPDKFKKNFDKVLYRLDSEGARYILSVMSLLKSFFNKLESEEKFTENMYFQFINQVYEKLIQNTLSPEIFVRFFLKAWSFIPKPYDSKYTSKYFDIFNKCREGYFNSSDNGFSEADREYFDLVSQAVRRDLLIHFPSDPKGNPKRKHKGKLPFYQVHKMFCDTISILVGKSDSSLILEESDVFTVIESVKHYFYGLDDPLGFNYLKCFEDFFVKVKEKDKKRFIEKYVNESLYHFISIMNNNDINALVVFLEKNNKSHMSAYKELKHQIKQAGFIENIATSHSKERFDVMMSYFSMLGEDDGKSIDNEIKKISPTFLIVPSKSQFLRTYLFLCHLFLCSTVSDLRKVIFFQLTRLDSSFFLSWKSNIQGFSPLSPYIARLLRGILTVGYIKNFSIFKFVTNALLEQEKYYYYSSPDFDTDGIAKVSLDGLGFKGSGRLEELDPKRVMKITLAPIGIWGKSYDFKRGGKLRKGIIYNINRRIVSAINHAIRVKSNLVIFPECSIPQENLNYYLKLAGDNGIILIGGLEHSSNRSNQAWNSAIVSIPCNVKENPFGKTYWPFIQNKIYPAAKESFELRNAGGSFEFIGGKELIIFESNKWRNFSILTCADFLSLKHLFLLQGRIQSLFVPSLNKDSSTFEHNSQTAIRQLYCYSIICNNSFWGKSSVYAPYRKSYERTIFSIEGKSTPNFHTIEISPQEFNEVQDNEAETCFFEDKEKGLKKYKQLPPGWKKIS